nr:glycoprotein 3-alpha-L-fucosyltransferase A-like [Procambarus clarkii]XP_045624135.1 glycoprotein 3-alpha-L-fucosyltransferase A-like [Procambarus clarkii]
MHLRRVAKAWRLHWLLLLFICILVALNILYTSFTKRNHLRSNVHDQAVLGSGQFVSPDAYLQELHQKGALPQLLSVRERLTPPVPVVKKELSFGVHEEENSAREVLDMEANERDVKQGHILDADAANEVNSVEPDTNGNHLEDENIDEMQVTELEAHDSFHELPLQQGDNFKVENASFSWGSVQNWRSLNEDEVQRLSVLGRRLYLNEKIGKVKNRTFSILVWKSGPAIERRLLKEYGKKRKDPFRKCSAHNCRLTYRDEAAKTADAILIHLHRTEGPHTFPNRTKISQRWIWLTDESPYNTFMVAKDNNMANYNGYFNWSMSYRMDSDVPVPYGRTVEMSPDEAASYQYVDYFKLKPKTVAILGSNCGGINRRWAYVRELKKHMEVDAYGGCGNLKCPGHFTKDCEALNDYKFYLAFENGDCREYITEKVWWNALGKGAVPVVMGAPVQDYKKILPPNSFIHINDFPSPRHLAKHLMFLASNPEAYSKYHDWRSRYRVLNEHGYFASQVFHYCRICEALNYNDPAPKVYNNMEVFWNKQTHCFPPTWEDRMKSHTLTKL